MSPFRAIWYREFGFIRCRNGVYSTHVEDSDERLPVGSTIETFRGREQENRFIGRRIDSPSHRCNVYPRGKEIGGEQRAMTGRVAILKRGDREIRMLCPDQDAALQWMKENWQQGDEFVAIVWLDVLLAIHTRPFQSLAMRTRSAFSVARIRTRE